MYLCYMIFTDSANILPYYVNQLVFVIGTRSVLSEVKSRFFYVKFTLNVVTYM
jgi:hypothetical protein